VRYVSAQPPRGGGNFITELDPGIVNTILASPSALVMAIVVGALWGSFLNVCVARIPMGKSVVRPGSHCFACGASIKPYDNVPLLSYLWLRGRCRACGARFSARYLWVEALMAAFSGLLYSQFVPYDQETDVGIRLARFAVFFAFAGVLLVLSFIDLDTQRLPDVITLPSIVIFFAAGFSLHMAPWKERAIGLVAGYVTVRIVADAYYYVRGREGLGLGDGKLLAVVGGLLGWKALPVVVFIASLWGVMVSLPLLAWGARGQRAEADSLRYTQVPFGPFLAAAALGYVFAFERLAPKVAGWLAGE
jgi:leader peptidase (prepilin peptidase)/N-methyltransferase